MRKKWWLFHAMDFQSLMYPCFFFCYIVGIFPYKLNASIFVVSKPYYILSTMIVCIAVFLNLIFIYDIIISKYNFGNLIKNIRAINYHTLSGFIAITTHILSGPRMRLLQTILEISSKLPPNSYQKLSRLIHIKDIFGTILLVVQLSIFYSKNLIFETNCMTVSITVFTIYFASLIFQMNMLYINCVCIMKACFKRINENLVHIQKLIKNDIKPYIKFIYCMQKNQFLLVKLKILKKRHLMISDTVQTMNTVFSLQLLATVVTTFVEITFELYFYVVRWQNGVFFSLDKHILDVLLTSTGYNILKMMLLAWACETGKNQAQEIGTTIHDLFNSTNDEQIKNELYLFSLQILHRENTFSAKVFTVDAMFLATVVSNVATYLIILIQFLNISHFCDGKTAINVTQYN